MERKVGDRIIIREWEDMVKEFGYGQSREIACDASFTTQMRYLCGLEVYIVRFLTKSPYNNKARYSVSLKENSSFTEGWTISEDMVSKEDYLLNKKFIVKI